MSNIASFREKARTDAGLKAQLRGIKARTPEETVKRVVDVAGKAGYRFTAEELRKEIDRRSQELSPEQLDAVAGGVWEENPLAGVRQGPTSRQIIAILIGL